MRMVIDLPEHLIEEAMKVSGGKTINQVIISALEDLTIKKSRVGGLKKFKGKINLDIDLDVSRERQ